jgi:hypothetical protein
MRTFTILFILAFFVSCASTKDVSRVNEEPFQPYTDYPGFYR